jgi:hypothetical protein
MSAQIRLSAAAVFVVLSALGLAGCADYYKVTDLQNGGVYFTKDVDDAGKAGAVRFRDERTHSMVTLPSSQVREISHDRYEEGLIEGK